MELFKLPGIVLIIGYPFVSACSVKNYLFKLPGIVKIIEYPCVSAALVLLEVILQLSGIV